MTRKKVIFWAFTFTRGGGFDTSVISGAGNGGGNVEDIVADIQASTIAKANNGP